MHYFQLLPDLRVTSIDELIEKSDHGHMTHCKVKRTRGCWPFPVIYFHHFIILCICKSKMTVAHYWPTLQGLFGRTNSMGKVVLETLAFDEQRPNKPCDLLDFSSGVHVISSPHNRRDPSEAFICLLLRLNESYYNITSNNCEHFVNDILYKTQVTNQSESMIVCSNLCGALLHDFRGYIVRLVVMTLIVSFSIGGLLGDSSAVVVISAIIFSFQENGINSCKSTAFGQAILRKIHELTNYAVHGLESRNDRLSVDTIGNITTMLSKSSVCNEANINGKDDAEKVYVLSMIILFLIDFMYTYNHVFYETKFLEGINSFWRKREVIVRVTSVVFSNVSLCGIGYLTLYNTSARPFLVFFFIFIGCAVFLRYTFIFFVGWSFDRLQRKFPASAKHKIRNIGGLQRPHAILGVFVPLGLILALLTYCFVIFVI